MKLRLTSMLVVGGSHLREAGETTGSPGIRRTLKLRNKVVTFAVAGWLSALFLTLTSTTMSLAATTVTLSAGANIQAAINKNPAGTTFTLKPGVYRMQSLVPLKNDKFIGQTGADLNGSTVVTNWVHSGIYWVSSGNVALNTPFGSASLYCQSAASGCAYPQDLYLNNVPLAHQLSLPITTGQWYFDYLHDVVYMANNPTGQVVELSVTKQAFTGTATNVTVQNMIVEKYATSLLAGTIAPSGAGWIIQSNEVRLNHGEGIKPKKATTQILSNNTHDNGEAGMALGGGSGSLIKNNTVSHNNYAKCAYGEEAGGVKLGSGINNQVLNNTIVNNDGNGIWQDGQGSGVIISGNTINNNTANGIRYEYSSYGTISNNVLKNNAQNPTTGVCTPNAREIVASDSTHVSISGNTITSHCAGITLTNGNPRNAPVVPVDMIVTDNTTTYTAGTAPANPMGAMDTLTPPPTFNTANNNYFDYNTYHFNSTSLLNLKNWMWGGTAKPAYTKSWSQWKAAGQDIHGSAD